MLRGGYTDSKNKFLDFIVGCFYKLVRD